MKLHAFTLAGEELIYYEQAGEGLLIGPEGYVLRPCAWIESPEYQSSGLRPATEVEAEAFMGWGEDTTGTE